MWEIIVRSKLQPLLSDCLRSERCKARLGREWVSQGRQAPPRMLFYFATCPAGESQSYYFFLFYFCILLYCEWDHIEIFCSGSGAHAL